MAVHLSDVQAILAWCTAINYGLLAAWFAIFSLGHDWLYGFHSRWVKLSPESFDALNYGGITFYKIAIHIFNLVPLIAVHLVLRHGP